MFLFWLVYSDDGGIAVVIQRATSLTHARMKVAIAKLDEGTFTEGHQLDATIPSSPDGCGRVQTEKWTPIIS